MFARPFFDPRCSWTRIRLYRDDIMSAASSPAPAAGASVLSAHAINQSFTSAVHSGMAVETAAVHALQSCQAQGLQPTTALFNNILGTLAKAAPPEIVAALAVQGRSGSVQMFSEGDIGVLPPLGVYDPLGLIETRDMRRYEIMEIKHGRAAMLGFLHIIAIHAGIRVPGYLSVSQDLKFSDVPAGCFASLEAVPTAGWLQIMVLML